MVPKPGLKPPAKNPERRDRSVQHAAQDWANIPAMHLLNIFVLIVC
jgi:hypothetical protein